MDVSKLADEWLRIDQDPITRSEIANLVASNSTDELERRLGSRIKFGTAGLRAKAEAGFSRMNCVTVIQTSQGLAQHLLDIKPDAVGASIVIGFDGRRDSRRFAEVAAAAFRAYGFGVIWFNDFVHTPLVPFTVKTKQAAAGVMITASHNPKDDNGYKVYGSNGCQINTPEDEAIAVSILRNQIPRTWTKPDLQDHRATMTSAYIRSLKDTIGVHAFPRFVYTPMHGVGLPYLYAAIESTLDATKGIVTEILRVVPTQATPDPDFPTVAYPNPEEDGALDLAKAQADSLGIDLIVANDPDADRLAVATKVGSGWYQFKGDEVGALLGYFISQSRKPSVRSKPVMLTSAVSSEMLATIGKAEGFDVEETLTGFKWIGNRALQIGDRAIYGYEEALGYMLPNIVHDKDGVAAALTMLKACSTWGKSPFTVMQELYAKYGYFDTANTYFKTPDVQTTTQTFDSIRTDPMAIARSLGGSTKCRVRDLVAGTDTEMEDHKATLPVIADNLMMTLWLSGRKDLFEGVRCTIRASGTEPKIKVYIECQSKKSLEEAKNGALNVLKLVRQTWFLDSSLKIEPRYEALSRP